MARASRQQSEATAAAILDAARDQFGRRGVADVGLDEIAAGAGVTRGAVYHHFGSKRGVFLAVHSDAQAQVAAAITEATDGMTDPWEALGTGCRAFLEASVRDDVRRILLVDAPAVLGWNDWREQDLRHSGRLLAGVLADLEAAGLIEVGNVQACQALLSGAMNEAALWAASLGSATEGIEQAWPLLRRMLDALRP
ncbi:TetR/AcrR family transcriptional regulator [Rhodococcus sp. NPDC058505]|uniref:TetR/AcrR family transcriptional regulator n=1 Tax=Rhodococcus sp. NPDC058505 TaxID=3346531 RepID=UPI0036514574